MRALATKAVASTDAAKAADRATTTFGERNVRYGWMTICLGAISGCVLMAWSFSGPFSPPPGFADYADLSRRMMRLGHIALFMLPVLNIVLGRDLDAMALSHAWKRRVSVCALFAMWGIPLGLTLGALVDVRLKYVAAMPVSALTIALIAMGVGALRSPHAIER